jgi:hypothetical protein
MSKPSTASHGGESRMLSAGDFLAKTSAQPEKAQESKGIEAACGGNTEGFFAKLDQNLHSWRTAQCSLFGGLTPYSGTWPKWGMMRTGACWDVAPLVPPMTAKERGCWLGTPTATMSQRSKKFLEGADRLPTPAELVRGVPNQNGSNG